MAPPPSLCLTFALLTQLTSAFSLHDRCIDSRVCSCNAPASSDILCDCSGHRSNLTIWPFTLQQTSPSRLSVLGCHSVRFLQVALPSCPPGGVRVVSVSSVDLSPLSLHQMSDCLQLTFSGVTSLTVGAYAFHQVTRVRLVEFRDAALGTLVSRALDSLLDIDVLTFANCTLDALEPHAVSNATAVGRISFLDCDVRRLSGQAVSARDVGRFEMLRCTVDQWDDRAVALVNVSGVRVANCSVGRLGDAGLQVVKAGQLDFVGNRVDDVHAGAFDGFRDVRRLTVADNSFGAVEAADALGALLTAGRRDGWTMVAQGNRLPCDDRLCVLLSRDDEDDAARPEAFFGNTFCPDGEVTLGDFLSLMDDDDVCAATLDDGQASGGGNASVAATADVSDAEAVKPSAAAAAAALLLLSVVLRRL